MKPIEISTKGMGHDEWLAERRKGIGGSDIAAVIGLNRWRSPIDVWIDKTGRADERPASEAMRQGSDLEDYVARRFEEATGKKVRRKNAILVHPDIPCFRANVDREVVGENAILECKTTSVYSADRWKDGAMPEEYYCQVQWYLGVTGRQHAYLACVIFNREFLTREIERDDEAIEALFRAGNAFWEEYVLKGAMPPPDGSEAAGDALRELYAESDTDGVVELYGFADRLRRYRELSALQAELGVETERIKQEIQAEMGHAETGFLGNARVTWKHVAGRRTVDAKRLAKEQPETFERYSKAGMPSRRFQIDFADEQ